MRLAAAILVLAAALPACSGDAVAPPQPPPTPPAAASHRIPPDLLQRYRPAIEGYTPSVQRGNLTRLDGARVPFATYLVAMHNRIHPIFSDEELPRIASTLPQAAAPGADLQVGIEIVIAKDSGRIVRMGVFRPSGVAGFDLAVLAMLDRAAPFGPAPDVIASPDGNVYVHWDFHSNPTLACIPINARPFILQHAP